MTFENYVEQLGKTLGMELDPSDGAIGVEVDGVTVLVHDAGEFVLMRAEIGGTLSADLAKAALEANWLYQGTGGSSLAVNPDDGALWLQKYNWLERLDADAAVKALTGFAQTAMRWREIAAGAGSEASPRSRARNDELRMTNDELEEGDSSSEDSSFAPPDSSFVIRNSSFSPDFMAV